MSVSLAEALEQVDLQAGKTYRCQVKGRIVLVRVVDDSSLLAGVARLDESDVMLDPWAEFPMPTTGRLLQATPGQMPPPDIPEIPQDEDDA